MTYKYYLENSYKKLCYIKGQQVTPDGVDMIICCVKVLSMQGQYKVGILDKVRELAVFQEEGHYTAIVEKSGMGDYNTEVSKTTKALLNRLKEKEREGDFYNYMIDRESGSVIWKLGVCAGMNGSWGGTVIYGG